MPDNSLPSTPALTKLLKLIEDGVLVRNTSNDGDTMAFLKQGVLIAETLKEAQDALGQSSPKGEKA